MSVDVQGAIKRFSGAVIRPVLFLAVAGILLALSVILKMEGMPAPVVEFGNMLYTCVNGGVVSNLGLIFCVGLTAALADKKKGDAATIAVATYLVFLYANNTWMSTHGMLAGPTDPWGGLYGSGQGMILGIQAVDTGVFIGIILGCLNGWLFNKFCDVKFPEVVSTYGGTKFVFLLAILSAGIIGILMSYIWPVFNNAIGILQDFMKAAGYAGVFVYAFLNKLLIPTGMHHLLWMPFMYTAVGGTVDVGGQAVSGSYNIFMAELGNLKAVTAMDESIRFSMLGFGKWFGTIGSVLAFISVAKPEHRSQVRAMLIPTALVAVLAGVTEPFDFMYLWASPVLYVVNSALDGIFQVILYAFGWRALLTGLIETIPGLIALPPELSHWYVVIPVGIIATFVWFLAFRFLILKLNLPTPGRDAFEAEIEGGSSSVAVAGAATIATETALTDESIANLIEGLGGADNIKRALNCFTRLRIDVNDMSLVDMDKVNTFKNTGIIKGKNNLQIAVGMKVEEVCNALNKALGREI